MIWGVFPYFWKHPYTSNFHGISGNAGNSGWFDLVSSWYDGCGWIWTTRTPWNQWKTMVNSVNGIEMITLNIIIKSTSWHLTSVHCSYFIEKYCFVSCLLQIVGLKARYTPCIPMYLVCNWHVIYKRLIGFCGSAKGDMCIWFLWCIMFSWNGIYEINIWYIIHNELICDICIDCCFFNSHISQLLIPWKAWGCQCLIGPQAGWGLMWACWLDCLESTQKWRITVEYNFNNISMIRLIWFSDPHNTPCCVRVSLV